ncbi:hypothetical protein ACFU93_43165 [Streptomyces sp. NPDC057611]|uniref:hypothetical protein n=1 Tax=Streptomyces sp. NPDC057611 TaxID=3346182 RepID=UPI0036B4BDD7
MKAAADLDGNADFATVRYSGGPSLPQEITGGRTLSIALTVATDGLPRPAWKQDLNTRQWSVTVFDESILR